MLAYRYGTVSEEPSLNTKRHEHTATRLNDGRVFISGGSSGGYIRKSTEMFEPAWAEVGPMKAPRYGHQATLIDGNQVLVGNVTGPTAEIYEPDSRKFVDTENAMVQWRISHTATALQDGTVLLAGGYDHQWLPSKTAERYIPGQGFTTLSPMSFQRAEHTATLMDDGRRVLIAGGWKGLAKTEIYDPDTLNNSA